MRAAAVLQSRLVPQPFRLAECGSSRGLRHHALGRHGGREDPAAGSGQGVPFRPRPPSPGGGFPGPARPLAVWLRAAPPPACSPTVPVSRCGRHRPRTGPLPTCVLDLGSAACKFSGFHPWGRATLPGSSGPGDMIWFPSFKIRIHYPSSGASLAHASPALPEEVESRWQRPGVRES